MGTWTEWALALAASLMLALIHWPRVPLFARSPATYRALASFSGGVSLSYVVLHLLKELFGSAPLVIHGILPFGPSPLGSLLLVLLAALVLFYVLHAVVERDAARPHARHLLVTPYILYNAVVGGAILGEETHEGPLNLLLFLLALGLHMMVNDYQLTQQLPPEEERPWRLALAIAPVVGCLLWLLPGVSSDVFYFLLAFIVGSNILTVLQLELPVPAESRIRSFLLGASLITLVTLFQWWL